MTFDEFDQALWEKVCKKQHILDYSTVQRVFNSAGPILAETEKP